MLPVLAAVVFLIPAVYGFMSDDMQDALDIDLMQFAAALIATAGFVASDPENRKARATLFLIAVWCWWVSLSDSLIPWVPPGLSAVEAGTALLGLWWVSTRKAPPVQ